MLLAISVPERVWFSWCLCQSGQGSHGAVLAGVYLFRVCTPQGFCECVFPSRLLLGGPISYETVYPCSMQISWRMVIFFGIEQGTWILKKGFFQFLQSMDFGKRGVFFQQYIACHDGPLAKVSEIQETIIKILKPLLRIPGLG